MKRSDLRFVVFVLSLSLVLFAAFGIFAKRQSGGETFVRITVDGAEEAVYPLSEDLMQRIEGKNGNSLVLHIEEGGTYVTDATCPDKICVHQGRIQNVGEMIVCMPSRIVVEII